MTDAASRSQTAHELKEDSDEEESEEEEVAVAANASVVTPVSSSPTPPSASPRVVPGGVVAQPNGVVAGPGGVANGDALFEALKQHIDQKMAERDAIALQRMKTISVGIAQAVDQTMQTHVREIVKQEMETRVPQLVASSCSRSMEAVMTQFVIPAIKKISDGSRAAAVAAQSNGSSTSVDAAALDASVKNHINTAVQGAFQTQVVPAMQKTMEKMLSQINGSLHQAIQTVEENQGTAQNIMIEVGKAIQTLTLATHSVQENTNATLANIQASLDAYDEGYEEDYSHMSVVTDFKELVDSLLERGAVEDAFVKTLSNGDVSHVLRVCRKLDPDVMEGLRSHILLSLMQQLSFDLSEDTHLKLEWISQGATHLDRNEPLIKDHIGAVLGEIDNNIAAYMEEIEDSDPQFRMGKLCRRLLKK